MKTAYSYLRWSTAGQGDSGRDSRSRQNESVSRWIKEHGQGEYTLSTQTFVDAGKSAHSGKHIAKDEYGKAKGELMRFIQLVETDKIKRDSILCIDSFDRFSRLPPTKSLTLFMQVIDSGIGLVFTGSHEKRIINSDLINKEGYVLQFIIGEMIRSYNESAEKSRKIISAKRNKKARMEKGEIVAHNNIPKYFTFRDGKYHHNANTPIVKELADGVLAGKSLFGLAKSLNERRVKTFRRGFEWSGNSIRAILRNRVLIGEYVGCQNYVPPVLDETTFNRVNNILSQNTYNRGRQGLFINIFRGVCQCADCGKSMSVATQRIDYISKKPYKNGPYRYIKCAGSQAKMNCNNRGGLRLQEMEQEFFMLFLFKNPTQLLNDGDNKELKQLKADIIAAQSQLNKVTRIIEDTVALIGTVSNDELKVKLSKLNKERDTLKAHLDSYNSQVAAVQDAPETFKDLRKLVLAADTDTKVEWNSDGVPMFEVTESDKKFAEAVNQINQVLKDNFTREGIRIMLPALIGKITVDTNEGRFYVYNRLGKVIYKSLRYESQRNNTEVWRDSLNRNKAA